jgi:hypothetical protein
MQTFQESDLKSPLVIALAKGSSLMGSYLDNLGSYHYAILTILWQDFGAGTDSILSFAEKIRRS